MSIPNLLRPGDPAPARQRLPLWTDELVRQPRVRGIYSHVTPAMIARIVDALEHRRTTNQPTASAFEQQPVPCQNSMRAPGLGLR